MFQVWIACLAAIILGLLNMFVKTVIGHFIFTDHSDDFRDLLSVHQRLYVELTSFLVGNSFEFSSFWSAMMVAIILSIVNLVITNLHYTK